MSINSYNSLMQLVFIGVLFSFGTSVVCSEDIVISPLDLNKVTAILNEKGAEKAYSYIYDGGLGGDGAKFPTFMEYISSGNSDWFRVLTRMSSEPLESKQMFAVKSVAEAVVEHPVEVFEYWYEVLPKNKYMVVNCTAWYFLIDNHYYEALGSEFGIGVHLEAPLYITMPMYKGVLEKRRKAAMTIDDRKLQSIRNQCVEQVDSTLALFKIKYENKLGFISNEKGRYIYSNKDQKYWYNKAELIPSSWDEEIGEILQREEIHEGRNYYRNVYYFLKHETRWPLFMSSLESAEIDWLLFLKEVYLLTLDELHRIDRDVALGQALTKAPQAVFSIFKEEFSTGGDLRKVCGNTYEDLLWGVGVEELVIGSATEKLEARKKSVETMKGKKIEVMKNKCIKAVDDSLAIWKGRAQ